MVKTILLMCIGQLWDLLRYPHHFFRDIWAGFKLGYGKAKNDEKVTADDVINLVEELNEDEFL